MVHATRMLSLRYRQGLLYNRAGDVILLCKCGRFITHASCGRGSVHNIEPLLSRCWFFLFRFELRRMSDHEKTGCCGPCDQFHKRVDEALAGATAPEHAVRARNGDGNGRVQRAARDLADCTTTNGNTHTDSEAEKFS